MSGERMFRKLANRPTASYTRTFWYLGDRKVSHEIARHAWMMYLHKHQVKIEPTSMEFLYTHPEIIIKAGISSEEWIVYVGGKS